MTKKTLSSLLLAGALTALPACHDGGTRGVPPNPPGSPEQTNSVVPKHGPYPEPPKVGFDQKLDSALPLDVGLVNERGEPVKLGAYFKKRPVVLAFVYYGCPMLCGHVLSGILSSARTLPLDAGSDYDIVIVSIDPREKPSLAAAKKAAFVERYKRPTGDEGWHFLTGDEASIARLTEAAGFRYELDRRTGEYAHAAGILVVTPEGRISRYFFGTEYSPRDMKFALIDASSGKVGKLADRLMLLCYRYDPVMGTYSAKAMGAVRLGGVFTVLSLGAFITLMIRRERRRKRERWGDPNPPGPQGSLGSVTSTREEREAT